MAEHKDRTETEIQMTDVQAPMTEQKLSVIRHFGTDRTSREAVSNLLRAHAV